MPIPDNEMLIAEVTHRGVSAAGGGSSKNFANVYHFRRTNVAAAWSDTAICNAFIANIVPSVCAALNADYTTTDILSRCVNDATGPITSIADATVGAIAGDRLPDFNAGVLIFRTTLRGRNYRGRKHYGPFSETDIGDDIFNAGALGRLGTIQAAVQAGFTDAGGNVFIPCVLSRTLSQLVTNPTTVTTADINNILINKTLGTLRRRKVPTVR